MICMGVPGLRRYGHELTWVKILPQMAGKKLRHFFNILYVKQGVQVY